MLKRYNPNHGIDRNILVLALHKSGSMFLYRFFKALSFAKGIHYLSKNNRPPDIDVPAGFSQRYCKCPVRLFPASLTSPIDFGDEGLDDATPKHFIVQTRDPRDILVSQYYSFGWMHAVPQGEPGVISQRERIQSMTIDEYALDWAMDALLEKCSNLLAYSDQVTLLRYEDMVLRFPTWATQAVVPFAVPPAFLQMLVNRFAQEFEQVEETTPEQIMAGERAHKRKMIPGDYKEKLQPETIAQLNEKFGAFLDANGYSRT